MSQKFYNKASVQTAMVSGVVVIIVTAATIWHQRSELKQENERLNQLSSEQSTEIQRLETLLTPFRTIALEKYTGTEAEALQQLANRIAFIEKEAAEARVALKEAQDRLSDIQEMRRLPKEKADRISQLLKSDIFKASPDIVLRVGSVSDTEAYIYAMDFLTLFKDCGIKIYPTPMGRFPNDIVQLKPHDIGLVLEVNDVNNPIQAFVELVKLMVSLDIPIRVGQNEELKSNEALLSVLKKPI